MRQVELAQHLGISRTPLREALMKLEQEGLITMLPRGGLKVVELDAEGAVELYEVREMLDGLAARLAAQRIDQRGVRKLEGHLDKMAQASREANAYGWFLHHVGFHEAIFEASANSRLLGLLSTVRLSVQRFHPMLLRSANRLGIALEEHGAIYEAIRAGDPDQAERLARLHIANAKAVVVELMAKRLANQGSEQ